jgi:hypothetical protein
MLLLVLVDHPGAADGVTVTVLVSVSRCSEARNGWLTSVTVVVWVVVPFQAHGTTVER